MVDSRLLSIAQDQPYPLLFATLSGAHLYGFASEDSDYDLRGSHLLPVEDVIGLSTGPDSLQVSRQTAGLELDLVTHDILKFCRLLLENNGYVLEQLYSPLVVLGGPSHDELKAIARGCITRQHVHHYLGFFRNQWELVEKEEPPRLKPLLYCYRVLLTGIHLMRTGEVVADLGELAPESGLPYLDELILAKRGGSERGTIRSEDVDRYQGDLARLEQRLVEAGEESELPAEPQSRVQVDDYVKRIRLGTLDATAPRR